MKITGGQAGGLTLHTPPGNRTRPSTDRLRESLFAILSARIPGSRVLDLYAGTGSLGIEAASRGAVEVHWVERHGPTLSLLKKNVARLAPAGVEVVSCFHRSDVFPFLKGASGTPFDLILVDPPYADLEESGTPERLFDRIREGNWLHPDGMLVLESESRWAAPDELPGWELSRRKVYGSSAVSLWQPQVYGS